MAVLGHIRGHGRLALLHDHRLAVFTRVFGEYIDGKAGVDDVVCRAYKLKLLRRKRRRRYLPQRGDNGL